MSKFIIKKATRQRTKMKIGLLGPSGSGKTYSALRLAKGLVGDLSKVVVIDTENGSADLYSHLGEYNTLSLEAPYDPRRYVEAIKACEQFEGIECIIIDSISHEWEGKGGCLDIHSKSGGKFQDWAKVTPLHMHFIDNIVRSPCHVITTCRTKIDYEINKLESGGKTKVEKVGLKGITREGFDYELTLSFKIDENHLASIDKDRTDLFKESVPFLITEETGSLIIKWNEEAPEVKLPSASYNKFMSDLSDLTSKFTDKEKLNQILSELNVKSSKEVAELDDNALLDMIAKLGEYAK